MNPPYRVRVRGKRPKLVPKSRAKQKKHSVTVEKLQRSIRHSQEHWLKILLEAHDRASFFHPGQNQQVAKYKNNILEIKQGKRDSSRLFIELNDYLSASTQEIASQKKKIGLALARVAKPYATLARSPNKNDELFLRRLAPLVAKCKGELERLNGLLDVMGNNRLSLFDWESRYANASPEGKKHIIFEFLTRLKEKKEFRQRFGLD